MQNSSSGGYDPPARPFRTVALVCEGDPLCADGGGEELFKEKYVKWTGRPRSAKEIKDLTVQELKNRILKTGEDAIRYSWADVLPIENPLFGRGSIIFNIPRRDAEAVAVDFGQKYFYFAEIKDGTPTISLFRAGGRFINLVNTRYSAVDKADHTKEQLAAEDFLSRFIENLKKDVSTFEKTIRPVWNEEDFEKSFEKFRDGKSRAMHRRDSRKIRASQIGEQTESGGEPC